MKMKTVIILVDQLYLHGGIEKLVAIKANWWSEKFGYKIVIVSTEQQGKPSVYSLSDKIEFIDINVNYHREISFFHPKNFAKLYTNIHKLKNIFKVHQPDFILVASHIPMTYVLPFLSNNAKIIKEFHYSKSRRVHTKKEKYFSMIEKKYDYLVVLSEEEKTFYSSDNVKVIPNPVTQMPEYSKSVREKENIAGAILRFAPVKQVDKMVAAWEVFYQSHQDWKLHIYGATDNAYFEEIRSMVHRKNLEQTVIFKGQTNDVENALAEMKILLMTSENECFPMVILEANASGVPVVSFDSPTGPRNIIHQYKDGIIVPLNDIVAFGEALKHLASDEFKLSDLSKAAVQNAEAYIIDRVMNMWKKQIFEEK